MKRSLVEGFAGVRSWALIGGPLAALALVLFCDLDPAKPAVTLVAAVALLMAVWWITEALPLAITSLLPLVLFPALGIMDGAAISNEYINHIIFLFIGGFMVALAMERWLLHKRLALFILLRTGNRAKGILLGFMLASGFLSMWISNTATAMMMVPIALALIANLDALMARADIDRYGTGIFLGIAYSASIGGTATLVGTPPNLVFSRVYAGIEGISPEISFAAWMAVALPFAIMFMAVVWWLLVRRYCPRQEGSSRGGDLFRRQLEEMGPIGYQEKAVLVVFVTLALLWVTRADLNLGFVTVPGWSNIFSHPGYFNDGTVSIAMAVVLFLLPARDGSGGMLMDWETARKLPWQIVLLFGGGFALAAGFAQSGLSGWFADRLAGSAGISPLLIVALVCLLLTFLTELTSNTATAQIFLPLMATLGIAMRVHPLLVMVPATLSCSFAFMLPVATPPNAIVFGSEKVTVGDMARTGLGLNFIGIGLVTIYVYFIAPLILGVDLGVTP